MIEAEMVPMEQMVSLVVQVQRVILEIKEILVNLDLQDHLVFLEKLVMMVNLEKRDSLVFLAHVVQMVIMGSLDLEDLWVNLEILVSIQKVILPVHKS